MKKNNLSTDWRAEADLEADINEMENSSSSDAAESKTEVKRGASEKLKSAGNKIGGLFKKANNKAEPSADIPETIRKLSELKDAGILTQEEFESKKTELLAKL